MKERMNVDVLFTNQYELSSIADVIFDAYCCSEKCRIRMSPLNASIGSIGECHVMSCSIPLSGKLSSNVERRFPLALPKFSAEHPGISSTVAFAKTIFVVVGEITTDDEGDKK